MVKLYSMEGSPLRLISSKSSKESFMKVSFFDLTGDVLEMIGEYIWHESEEDSYHS